MPSFRVVVPVGAVRAGRTPPQVMDAAVAAARAGGHTVEAFDIEIVAGVPRVWVRFTVADASHAEESLEASEVGASVAAQMDAVARVGGAWVERRVGPRWHRI